ncbi:MAG: AAA domain-containing protein [Steroidobacteraceae bacterium]
MRRQQLAEQIAQNSDNLWKAWVHLTPKRLSSEQRKAISDYAAILPAVTSPDTANINPAARTQARKLQSKVTQIFACWAITSLSAKGRIPFEPGYFDLLVIDEASQCDIASALPLLYRAKRAVIIGDPQQLRHISALSPRKDTDLQSKYDLLESRTSWMYSTQSLYDLAAGVVQSGNILNLRDHHRSHADIINFANATFYGGRLRIATHYDLLRRPDKSAPGVVWHNIHGKTRRPPGGSADNPIEAKALVNDLRGLVVTRGFQGTVGVVTPFRAQVQLISRLVSKDAELSALVPRLELLVETVHRFQGDERDVMFFSPVVSDDVTPGALSFLRTNGNLFNVAITRARGLLQVVGDSAAAVDSGIDYLAAFARYAAELAVERQRTVSPRPTAELGSLYPTVAHPERVSDWERTFYGAMYAAGIRTVPQYSVDQYDLDFALFAGERMLDLEVDGERFHRSWTGELCLRDQLRNQRLIELGWEVKRFWVYEIRDRMNDCVAWVKRWQTAPAPEPSSHKHAN